MTKKTNLSYGHMGNGVSVWRSGTNDKVAHISTTRIVTFDKENRPTIAEITDIHEKSKVIEFTISATQDEMVLIAPLILKDPGMGKVIGNNKVLYRGYIYVENDKQWIQWTENKFK